MRSKTGPVTDESLEWLFARFNGFSTSLPSSFVLLLTMFPAAKKQIKATAWPGREDFGMPVADYGMRTSSNLFMRHSREKFRYRMDGDQK